MDKLITMDVIRLRDFDLRAGQRWIFSAGFNVPSSTSNMIRVDEEVDDLRLLINSGCRVSLLTHQGSFHDNSAKHLHYLADYLTTKLKSSVRYYPDNHTKAAIREANEMNNGDVVIFGNTRFHPGEQNNCKKLAETFSNLGDYAAIGGFSKCHRAHASNVGIQSFLPSVVASGLIREIEYLEPWTGRRNDCLSVAVLGGKKKEKLVQGLDCFLGNYDYVIPAGAVLNNILRSMGYEVGASFLAEGSENLSDTVDEIISRHGSEKLLLPQRLVVAPIASCRLSESRKISIGESISPDEAIVDFEISEAMHFLLDDLKRLGGRMLLAGTPAVYTNGFVESSHALLDAMSHKDVRSIVLGGDSVTELPFLGAASTGGGSALSYLKSASTPVLNALSENRRVYKHGI